MYRTIVLCLLGPAFLLGAGCSKSSVKKVSGEVRLKLYKGNVGVVGRESPYSLYDRDLVTFEEGKVAYDQRDAAEHF